MKTHGWISPGVSRIKSDVDKLTTTAVGRWVFGHICGYPFSAVAARWVADAVSDQLKKEIEGGQ